MKRLQKFILIIGCLGLFQACAKLDASNVYVPSDWTSEQSGNKKTTFVKACENKDKHGCPKIYIERDLLPISHDKKINYYAEDLTSNLKSLTHQDVKLKYSHLGGWNIATIDSSLEGLTFQSLIAILENRIIYFVYSADELNFEKNKYTFIELWKNELKPEQTNP